MARALSALEVTHEMVSHNVRVLLRGRLIRYSNDASMQDSSELNLTLHQSNCFVL